MASALSMPPQWRRGLSASRTCELGGGDVAEPRRAAMEARPLGLADPAAAAAATGPADHAAMEARPLGLGGLGARVLRGPLDRAAMEARPLGLADRVCRGRSARRVSKAPQWRRGLSASRTKATTDLLAHLWDVPQWRRGLSASRTHPVPLHVLGDIVAAMEARPLGLGGLTEVLARDYTFELPQWRRGLSASRTRRPSRKPPAMAYSRNGGEASRPRGLRVGVVGRRPPAPAAMEARPLGLADVVSRHVAPLDRVAAMEARPLASRTCRPGCRGRASGRRRNGGEAGLADTSLTAVTSRRSVLPQWRRGLSASRTPEVASGDGPRVPGRNGGEASGLADKQR